mmetsp:Transcript_30819/g.57573  ORF Transcript_30819/g.57573 Transcript_30819/m.57573 type:complete len:81 (-) Transcript_30819:255-497(-)
MTSDDDDDDDDDDAHDDDEDARDTAARLLTTARMRRGRFFTASAVSSGNSVSALSKNAHAFFTASVRVMGCFHPKESAML